MQGDDPPPSSHPTPNPFTDHSKQHLLMVINYDPAPFPPPSYGDETKKTRCWNKRRGKQDKRHVNFGPNGSSTREGDTLQPRHSEHHDTQLRAEVCSDSALEETEWTAVPETT